jgi:hypothetical protein
MLPSHMPNKIASCFDLSVAYFTSESTRIVNTAMSIQMVFVTKWFATCFTWKSLWVLFQIMPFQLQCMGKVLTTFLTDTLLTTFDMELQVLASGENLATFLTVKLFLHHLCIKVLSYLLCLQFPLLLGRSELNVLVLRYKRRIESYTIVLNSSYSI